MAYRLKIYREIHTPVHSPLSERWVGDVVANLAEQMKQKPDRTPMCTFRPRMTVAKLETELILQLVLDVRLEDLTADMVGQAVMPESGIFRAELIREGDYAGIASTLRDVHDRSMKFDAFEKSLRDFLKRDDQFIPSHESTIQRLVINLRSMASSQMQQADLIRDLAKAIEQRARKSSYQMVEARQKELKEQICQTHLQILANPETSEVRKQLLDLMVQELADLEKQSDRPVKVVIKQSE